MTHGDVYRLLELHGPQNIAFNTVNGTHVCVRASRLIRGPYKGLRVIRVEWAESASTLTSSDWERPEAVVIRHLVNAIKQHLSEID